MDSPFGAWRARSRRFADPGKTLLPSPSSSSFPTSPPSSSLSSPFLALPSPVFLESPVQGRLFLRFPMPGPCRRENHHPGPPRPAQQQMQAPPALFPILETSSCRTNRHQQGVRAKLTPLLPLRRRPRGGGFQEPSELSQL